MTSHPYPPLVRYKQWADRTLYDVVGQNLDRLGTQDAAILLRIFDHMHVVDMIFRHHVEGLPHSFKAPRSSDMPAFQSLSKSVRKVDDWYTCYVGNLRESDLDEPVDFVFSNGTSARMRRARSFHMFACTEPITGAMLDSFFIRTASHPTMTG